MAHAPENLMQMSGTFAGIRELLADPIKPANAEDLQDLIGNIAKLTVIAEAEMHDGPLTWGICFSEHLFKREQVRERSR